MTLEISAFPFLLLRPRHENEATERRGGSEGGGGEEDYMENLYLYTVVSRREGVNASRDPVSSRDIYFLYEFGRGGRLFDTANLVISGRQIRIPCRGGRGTQEAVVRGSIDAAHIYTHMHVWRDKMIGGDNLCL